MDILVLYATLPRTSACYPQHNTTIRFSTNTLHQATWHQPRKQTPNALNIYQGVKIHSQPSISIIGHLLLSVAGLVGGGFGVVFLVFRRVGQDPNSNRSEEPHQSRDDARPGAPAVLAVPAQLRLLHDLLCMKRRKWQGQPRTVLESQSQSVVNSGRLWNAMHVPAS
jgi:hypothetical protein